MKQFNMRSLQPKDVPRLIELHDAQNERDGTNYPLPILFGPDGRFASNIALALAVEKKGEVVQGVYFQSRIVEMCFAGCDPRATAHARREIDAVGHALRLLGYEGIRSMVPHVVVDQLEAPMKAAGFKRKDGEFASFFLDLEATK